MGEPFSHQRATGYQSQQRTATTVGCNQQHMHSRIMSANMTLCTYVQRKVARSLARRSGVGHNTTMHCQELLCMLLCSAVLWMPCAAATLCSELGQLPSNHQSLGLPPIISPTKHACILTSPCGVHATACREKTCEHCLMAEA
jgi:hypothetical protein